MALVIHPNGTQTFEELPDCCGDCRKKKIKEILNDSVSVSNQLVKNSMAERLKFVQIAYMSGGGECTVNKQAHRFGCPVLYRGPIIFLRANEVI